MRNLLTGNLKGRIITARLKYWAKAGGLCQEGILGIVNGIVDAGSMEQFPGVDEAGDRVATASYKRRILQRYGVL
jgi:hypothetical protein